MKRTVSLLMALAMIMTMFVGTAVSEAATLSFPEGTVLRMATGYNNAKTGLFFDASVAGEGVTLADGVTYHTGDLKPTWVAVQNELGMVFENKYQGNSTSAEFDYWKDRLEEVDMLSGTASKLSEYGENGSIVNISSIWGVTGGSCECHYSATKAAVIGYTKAMAKELGPSGIRINCIAPGAVDTDMNARFTKEDLEAVAEESALGYIGKPEEIAEAVFFAASEKASYMTGAVINVNGGSVI